jgi:hypothetical protein
MLLWCVPLLPYELHVALSADMRSMPYDGFKWILRTLDVNASFGNSIATKDKEATTVGYELACIWAMQGTPSILQSDNGGEFLGPCIAMAQEWSSHAVTIIRGR